MNKKWSRPLLFTLLTTFMWIGCSSQDNSDETTKEIVTQETALAKALRLGDAALVTEKSLLSEVRKEIAYWKEGKALLKDLYLDGTISYDAGNRSQLINFTSSRDIYPILYGNKEKVLAAAGEHKGTRFAAFGAAPTEQFADGKNLEFEPVFKRLILWLVSGETTASSLLDQNLTIALSYVKSDKKNITEWMERTFSKWTIKSCEDAATLQSCYSGSDLIISGWQSDENVTLISDALEQSMQEKIPLLYLHTWYEATNDLSTAIATMLGFELPYGGNYWSKDHASWTNLAQMQREAFASTGYASLDVLMQRYQEDSFVIDWSLCDTKGIGERCQYEGLFDIPMKKVHTNLNRLDQKKIALFSESHFHLEKLLVLLGDKFRAEVTYPMDKVTSDPNAFFRSLFADYTHYGYRKINPAQKDMGNFSRSDFSHVRVKNREVRSLSRRPFRSVGLYALPGETFKVTRKDNSDVETKVFVNTLRSGATHEFEENGYKRPKFLQSVHYAVMPGETLEITSAYGGVIEVAFDRNDQEVHFVFEKIGEHPYWSSSSDDERFAAALAKGDYDWVEIATEGFEVHSRLDKMLETLESRGSARALAALTQHYTSNYPLVLAGFQGTGIEVVSEISDFAQSQGWKIEHIEQVKHMNADQAACGYGCSGNPYDAYWAFNPLGHGDIHEIGHGLERSRFRFTGWEGHSTTNPYSYYTKSKYFEETGEEPECQKLPFKEVYTKLQNSLLETNATAYLQTNLWPGNWSNQVLMTIEMMMSIQKMGQDGLLASDIKVENGWHLLARLHILERVYAKAIKKDTTWDANKTALGFSSYTQDEAKVINNDDWMLIALSKVSGADFSDYLKVWGITNSAKAVAQVKSTGIQVVPKMFFLSTPDGYCKDDQYGMQLDKTAVFLDGNSTWPQ